MTDEQATLPDSPYYLLHPAFSEFVRQHCRGRFRAVPSITVGHNHDWLPDYGEICAISRALATVDDEDMHEEVQQLIKELLDGSHGRRAQSTANGRPRTERAADLLKRVQEAGYEDLYWPLAELL